MNPVKIVIIGGVAAGASAAAKARRTNEHAVIKIFEKGPYISFANCGLPYYISGDIAARSELLLQTPESFTARFNAGVFVNHEVTAIDRTRKIVTVKDFSTGRTFEENYDKLIIATGASAVIPRLPGADKKNVFTLKTVPDADKIKDYIEARKPKTAVVMGAGFIGLEIAEGLIKNGLQTTVVEMQKQVLPPLDSEMADYVASHIRNAGADLVLGEAAVSFNGGDEADSVTLASGRKIPAGIIIVSAGVRAETGIAKDCGLKISDTTRLLEVNEFMQTSDPDIYAAGDIVETTNLVTGKKMGGWLAGPANKQGRAAGANAAGGSIKFTGSLGTAIIETMGIAAAKTGLSERDAIAQGIKTAVSFIHPPNHASYYPGAEMLHMKLIAEKETGRLLGAQAVGTNGADKRIDVFAAAITAKMTAADAAALDLAYSPQFGSAKDPAIMAAMTLENSLEKITDTITPDELHTLAKTEEIQLVDVRTPAEFASGKLEGAINIPLDKLRAGLSELNPTMPTVVYCKVGLRGYIAERILKQSGFDSVKNLSGGILLANRVRPAMPQTAESGVIVSPQAAAEATKNGRHTLLDVREQEEYDYEHVEGSVLFPLSLMPGKMPKLDKAEPVYVLCQSGLRAKQAQHYLRVAGFQRPIVIEGGLSAWTAKGYPAIKRRGPLPIMRQVQITAGGIVLLSVLTIKYFWIAGIIGAGLMFAGITGTCGLAKMLSFMPWNKAVPPMKKPGSDAGAACGSGKCG